MSKNTRGFWQILPCVSVPLVNGEVTTLNNN